MEKLFEVVNGFRDDQDNKFEYKKTSIYPRAGYTPSEERIEELSSVHPKEKKIFIKPIQTEEKKLENPNGPVDLLTEADVKRLNKGPQEELIQKFGGDPSETKNEEERIALILQLQEEKQKEQSGTENEPSPE